jgi:hypothetical protein
LAQIALRALAIGQDLAQRALLVQCLDDRSLDLEVAEEIEQRLDRPGMRAAGW